MTGGELTQLRWMH